MKRQISILIVAASLGTSVAIAQQTEHEKQKYTCVMHPEVVMDHPGKCTKCGMTLVPLKAKSQRPTSNVQRPTPNEADMQHMHGSDHQHGMSMEHMSMQSSVNIADPMSRESSGTAWVPDSTPMYGKMFTLGDDMLMLHGGIFPRYTNVSTRRGDDRIDAPNWIMAMYSHPFSESTQLGARLMMSRFPKTSGPISPHIYMSVIRANRHSGRRRLCIGSPRWTIPTLRSVIIGRTQPTSPLAWRQPAYNGAT